MRLNTPLHTLWLGMTPYERSLVFQEDLAQRCREHHNSYIIGLEHPPSITLGRRAEAGSNLLWSAKELEEHALKTYAIERGGEATLHSPGQLVIYPVLDLVALEWGVRAYVDLLMKVTQQTLKNLGIDSQCQENKPGLFTSRGKIASFGIRVKRGVTQHGLAINCQNDLNLFASIRSCGVEKQSMTHLLLEGVVLTPRELFKLWYREFSLTVLDRKA